MQHLRRGHYELAVEAPPATRIAAAITELARAISPRTHPGYTASADPARQRRPDGRVVAADRLVAADPVEREMPVPASDLGYRP